ncbi:MAG: hypothetical protein ACI4BA_08950 [Prevotella sp.]
MKKNYIKPSIEVWKMELPTLMDMSMSSTFSGNLGAAHSASFDDDLYGDE